jgi:hypothetical protein
MCIIVNVQPSTAALAWPADATGSTRPTRRAGSRAGDEERVAAGWGCILPRRSCHRRFCLADRRGSRAEGGPPRSLHASLRSRNPIPSRKPKRIAASTITIALQFHREGTSPGWKSLFRGGGRHQRRILPVGGRKPYLVGHWCTTPNRQGAVPRVCPILASNTHGS